MDRCHRLLPILKETALRTAVRSAGAMALDDVVALVMSTKEIRSRVKESKVTA